MSMWHEMELHPDEAFFYNSASSVVSGDYSFKSVKANPDYVYNYPNGALVFQMPFQFAGAIEGAVSQGGLGSQAWGRIAAIFYFSAACFLGGIILYRNFGQKPLAVFFYALTMVFSLFHIEQSRYGTGDAISFFVLMVILYAIDIFFREGDGFYLYFAAFFTGALAAVKFPLLFFIIYPLCAYFIKAKQTGQKKSPLKAFSCIFVFALLGLLLFSPQWFVDKTFFMKAFFSELEPWVLGGNGLYADAPVNNFLYLLLYQLLYADFPLAAPLLIFGVATRYRQDKEQAFPHAFYALVLPVSIFLFFFYNLFATAVAFRTYYPYFCLCAFFTSYALSELFSQKKLRPVIIALSVFMALRGMFFVYALTEKSREEAIVAALTQHEAWDDRRMVVVYGSPDAYIPREAAIPQRKYAYGWADLYLRYPEAPLLLPGEFGVTAAYEYGMAKTSIFRARKEKERFRESWVAFREQMKDYVIGVSYPLYYHYIFGGWVPGSALAEFEFPVNYIYYRSNETGGDAGAPQKYRHLYNIDDWPAYLEAVARLDCTVILSSNGGLPEDFARAVCSLLSLDFEASLFTDQSAIFVFNPLDGEQRAVLNYSNESEIVILLTEALGAPSQIAVAADRNIVTVHDRNYATNGAGFNIVVYDSDMKCVMDWRSLAP
ncbi:MAG: hypothetical protein LBI54_03450 [Lachnospiraceae bacterium]|nr:hypothetical protein [Lachnospiraceae bacterium]